MDGPEMLATMPIVFDQIARERRHFRQEVNVL